jgi:hypothetical protein
MPPASGVLCTLRVWPQVLFRRPVMPRGTELLELKKLRKYRGALRAEKGTPLL